MKVLEKFVTLDQSRLEITERLEQLRLLENNIAIHIVVTNHPTCGVDRPKDIETVSNIIRTKSSAFKTRRHEKNETCN
jgi:3-deoxy-manno-octulosonate cytidylyltransferase (CMP-KDO synthetase)